MNNYEADFRACRACLSPASVFDSLQTFTSLFAENGKNVEMFGFISGIDVSDFKYKVFGIILIYVSSKQNRSQAMLVSTMPWSVADVF